MPQYSSFPSFSSSFASPSSFSPVDRGRHHASVRVTNAEPDAVFAFICDVEHLPRWNDAIVSVLTDPGRLEAGDQWKVVMRDGAVTWISRSTLIDCDTGTRNLTYRSATDDLNPSYTEWRWSVTPDGTDSVVDVRWRLRPKTATYRLLLAPYRAHGLRREVPSSLAALERAFRAWRPEATLSNAVAAS